jgi:hypothetical protein
MDGDDGQAEGLNLVIPAFEIERSAIKEAGIMGQRSVDLQW